MSGDVPPSVPFIAALDIGTTNIKCDVVDSAGKIIGKSCRKVIVLNPHPGWVEINPDELFKTVLQVIEEAVKNANTTFSNIKSIGVATHRCTFTTWRKDTGEYLHNFITWQDLRTSELLNELNSSLRYKILQWTSYGIYLFTRNEKYKLASQLKITTRHVTGRLLWVLLNVPAVKQNLSEKNLMFGTLDTWLIYKLTGGKCYVTDISNASASGLYDSFALNWSILSKLLRIPVHILPEVVSNDFDFGATDEELFGVSIRINCVLADQSASMFGTCCFHRNDLKLTLGTGAFLDVNTGTEIYPNLNGMYPLIGWRTRHELRYMLEVPCLEVGALFEEFQRNGIIENIDETSNIAYEVGNSRGVYFIPECPNGKLLDVTVSSRFKGTKENTTVRQKIRAIMEGVVFNLVMCLNLLKSERNEPYQTIKIDGGVAKNDFICQMLADLTDLPVHRLNPPDASTLGAAFIAGISIGIWGNQNEVESLQIMDRVFQPSNCVEYKEELVEHYNEWLKVGGY